LASLCSLCCPGIGHIYIGKTKLGFIGIGVYLVLLFLYKSELGSYPSLYITSGLTVYLIFIGAFIDCIVKCPKKTIQLSQWNSGWVCASLIGILVPSLVGIQVTGRYERYRILKRAMAPAVGHGDWLVVDRNYYSDFGPTRGEVIIFNYPKDPSISYINRVIAIPGDVVEIRDEKIILNGNPIQQVQLENKEKDALFFRLQDERFVGGWNSAYVEHIENTSYTILRSKKNRPDFGPVSVPADSYFVLGDNRDYSNDSRYWGFVPRSEINGKVLYILWNVNIDPDWGKFNISFDRTGTQL
jgi:signal peptidase I